MRKVLPYIFSLVFVVVYSQEKTETEGGKTKDAPRIVNMLTGNYVSGKYLSGVGFNYSNFDTSPYQRLGIGFYFGYEHANFKSNSNDLKVKYNSGQIGLRLMGRISDRFYISGLASVQVGQEKAIQKINMNHVLIGNQVIKYAIVETRNPILGLAASEGIFFVPKKTRGDYIWAIVLPTTFQFRFFYFRYWVDVFTWGFFLD